MQSVAKTILYAVLGPISGIVTNWWFRYQKYSVDQYYAQLTRESMRSQLRYELLDQDRDACITQLREALCKHNHLRHIFERFAVSHKQTGERVWDLTGFSAFIASQFGQEHGKLPESLTSILWRSFCYTATYPFFVNQCADSDPETIDLDSWVQAIALLATDAVRNVGRHRAGLALYGTSKPAAWLRFAGSMDPADGRASALAGCVSADGDGWNPPDVLDEITRVALAQLPLNPIIVPPPHAEVRSHVQRLADDSTAARIPITDLSVPYQGLLSLLTAIMDVEKCKISKDSVFETCEPVLASGGSGSGDYQVAAAKAILFHGGIKEDAPVTFGDYFHFANYFSFDKPGRARWCFDQELSYLWRALFFSPPESSALNPLPSQPNPPSVILQTLDFLFPLHQFEFPPDRRQSTLIYSTASERGRSRDEVLKAMTWPYNGRLVIIYGTVAASASVSPFPPGSSTPAVQASYVSYSQPDEGSPAILAMTTSSPLWCTFSTGATHDFRVGDEHFLLELTPRPRVLWFASERTKFVDLVDVAKPGSLSFGHVGDASSAGDSGLAVNFDAGLATLSSAPLQKERSGDGYVEVETGRGHATPRVLDSAQAWETRIRVHNIEVYALPGGVAEDLEVKRSSHSMSLRSR